MHCAESVKSTMKYGHLATPVSHCYRRAMKSFRACALSFASTSHAAVTSAQAKIIFKICCANGARGPESSKK
jgi:hypothetical protein